MELDYFKIFYRQIMKTLLLIITLFGNGNWVELPFTFVPQEYEIGNITYETQSTKITGDGYSIRVVDSKVDLDISFSVDKYVDTYNGCMVFCKEGVVQLYLENGIVYKIVFYTGDEPLTFRRIDYFAKI